MIKLIISKAFFLLKIASLISFLFISISADAQLYKEVDSVVKRYPKSFKSVESLTYAIQSDFSRKDDQVRAVYTWIALNIRYDIYLKENERTLHLKTNNINNSFKRDDLTIANTAMHTGKAVCEGYARLFYNICQKLGIQTEIIGGFTKSNRSMIGTTPALKNHAWNAYYVGNKWHLLDITWSAGYRNINTDEWVQEFDDSYYNLDPHRLIKTHYPAQEKWQLLDKPISKQDFFVNPIFHDLYFKTKTRLSPGQSGLITLDEKERTLYIYFDQIRDTPSMYRTRNTSKDRTIKFKRLNNGRYQGKIKLVKGFPSYLLIIEDNLPIIEFKINSTYNYQPQLKN